MNIESTNYDSSKIVSISTWTKNYINSKYSGILRNFVGKSNHIFNFTISENLSHRLDRFYLTVYSSCDSS